MKLLFALGLVLACTLAIQASLLSHSHAGDDIEALCARKSVDLTSFSQLKQLGQAAGSSAFLSQAVGCSATLRDAIIELVKLIETGKDDLCSVETITALRAYYGKYLDTSGPVTSDEADKELLPKSLKRFALAYGMQMSNLCKKNMVHVLSTEGSSLVDASDFEQINALIDDEGAVAQVLDAITNPGEVFLPGDLIPYLKKYNVQTNDLGSEKLIMQTATSDYIKQVQSVCKHRFKPVYEPLMMPLVRLVNMGFDYKDEPLKTDLASPAVAHDVARWSRIVFLCEALGNLRIVADKEDQMQAEGSSSMQVRILTVEEADAIEGARPPVESEEQAETMITDVVYTPHNKVTLGDEIYNKADKQLHKSIRSFKTNHGEEYVLRKRLTRKGFSLIKKQIKEGHFGFMLSAAWKALMRKGKAVNTPTQEFVETLNEMVEQQQQQANGTGGPVSAKKEVPKWLLWTGIVGCIVVLIVIIAVLVGNGIMITG